MVDSLFFLKKVDVRKFLSKALSKNGYMMIMESWIYPHDFHVSTREQASHFGGRCRCSSQSLSVKWKETLASLGCQHSQASCRHAALLLAALLRLWPRCGISILSQDFLCGKRFQIFECGECQGNRRQEMTQEYTRTFGLVN